MLNICIVCLCIFLYLYRSPYIHIHTCVCTIHLQFKNKINTTRAALRRYSCYSYCFCVVNWVTHLLQNFCQIISYIQTIQAHTHTHTHGLIKYKHLCKCICCLYIRVTASKTFKTISNQKSSTYRTRRHDKEPKCHWLLMSDEEQP